MKSLSRFLKIWDGIWSVPIAIVVFILVGNGIIHFFGPEAGSMLPVFIQRLFYAALCMVMANFITLFGMYMNFRRVFRFYLKDASAWENLPPTLKTKIVLGVYFGYVIEFILFLIFV